MENFRDMKDYDCFNWCGFCVVGNCIITLNKKHHFVVSRINGVAGLCSVTGYESDRTEEQRKKSFDKAVEMARMFSDM